MILKIWNYLQGYLIINVSGFSLERFLNLAANKNIFVWDIEYNENSINLKVSVNGYKKLKDAAKKTSCTMKIKKKVGLPFKANKLKYRQFYLIGAVLFFIILFSLSNFVWTMEINGNERISDKEISSFLSKNGLKVSSYKNKVDNNKLSKLLMQEFNEISWVAIKIDGSKVIVEIKETVKKLDEVDKDVPCDVVSTKTALVSKIVAKSGSPKVKAKDIVRPGDILISGELITFDGETPVASNFVHADGEVYGKCWYEINKEINLNYKVKKYTDNTAKRYKVNIFSKDFSDNRKIDFKSFDKEEKKINLIFMTISTYSYKEYSLINAKRTNKDAEDKIKEEVNELLSKSFDIDSTIESLDYHFREEDEKIIAFIELSTNERIDKKQARNSSNNEISEIESQSESQSEN